jgi:hypothetical protein
MPLARMAIHNSGELSTLRSGPQYTNFINCAVGITPLKRAVSFGRLVC